MKFLMKYLLILRFPCLSSFVSMFLPPPLTLINEYAGQLHQLAQIQVTADISVSHPELVLLPL